MTFYFDFLHFIKILLSFFLRSFVHILKQYFKVPTFIRFKKNEKVPT